MKRADGTTSRSLRQNHFQPMAPMVNRWPRTSPSAGPAMRHLRRKTSCIATTSTSIPARGCNQQTRDQVVRSYMHSEIVGVPACSIQTTPDRLGIRSTIGRPPFPKSHRALRRFLVQKRVKVSIEGSSLSVHFPSSVHCLKATLSSSAFISLPKRKPAKAARVVHVSQLRRLTEIFTYDKCKSVAINLGRNGAFSSREF